jgi:hypothetical protein
MVESQMLVCCLEFPRTSCDMILRHALELTVELRMHAYRPDFPHMSVETSRYFALELKVALRMLACWPNFHYMSFETYQHFAHECDYIGLRFDRLVEGLVVEEADEETALRFYTGSLDLTRCCL